MWGMHAGRIVAACLFGIAAVLGVHQTRASLGAERSASLNRAERVALFEAIENGEVEVTVIPQRSERVTLQIANKTERPLSIEIPEALAAGPVLAQLPAFPGLDNQNNANQNAPQAVGFPGPNNGQNNNVNAGPGLPFPMNPGIFNVPAGKLIKVKLPAACLEYGKREPHSRIAYELKPIDAVTQRKEVASILSMIGRKEVSRRIGQLAIWHLANGTEWTTLAKLRSDRIDGMVSLQYSAREIIDAQQLVKKVSQSPADEKSLSRR